MITYISDPHSKRPNNETKLNDTKTDSSTVSARNVQSTEIRAIQGEYQKQSNDVNETLEMKWN